MADIATLAMILIDPRSVVVYDLRDHSDPDSRRGAARGEEEDARAGRSSVAVPPSN
jgi:hypothetical protein